MSTCCAALAAKVSQHNDTQTMDQTLASVKLVTRPTSSAQFYLFNLFADYISPRGGRIWTSDLLTLLELLSVGQRTARSMLSRMKQRGWFVTFRQGREIQYALSDDCEDFSQSGGARLRHALSRKCDTVCRLLV